MHSKYVGLVLLLFLTFITASAQEKSRIAFKISEPDLIPEGIAYDSRTNTFYVGSTYLRKIISIDEKGVVKNFTGEAQDGLRGVLGMRVDEKRRVLWAISSHAGLAMPLKNGDRDCIGCSEVFKYDLNTGKLIKKYTLSNKPNQHFLNDLVINSNGDIYITDTVYGAIYFISVNGEELTEFLSLGKTSYPNGIDLSNDKKCLFIATNGKIIAVDLKSRKLFDLVIPAEMKIGGIDGLYFYKGSLIAIQPFDSGKTLVRYYLNKKHDTVVKMEVIEANHKLFNQPTTGTIVGNEFYYFANSQLQIFRRLFQPDGSFDKSKLSDVFILKIKI